MKKIKWISFINKKNQWEHAKIGDIVIGYTELPTDVYKPTDEQVKKRKRKIGKPKTRPGLILDIISKTEAIVIFATHSEYKNIKPFLAKNKTKNLEYEFRPIPNLIQIINPRRKNKLIAKAWEPLQLSQSELVVKQIVSSNAYSKELKKQYEKKEILKKNLNFKNLNQQQAKPDEPELEI